jgi:hypothetical protein
VTVTLAIHPLCGEELTVIAAYGRSAVQAETAEGKLRLLSLAWTSLQPRPNPLAFEGHVVRLAPDALHALASWVAARSGCQKLDLADREDQKPDNVVGKHVAAGAAAAAMVGQARPPAALRRDERKRGTR